jgi:hypothetical protein
MWSIMMTLSQHNQQPYATLGSKKIKMWYMASYDRTKWCHVA